MIPSGTDEPRRRCAVAWPVPPAAARRRPGAPGVAKRLLLLTAVAIAGGWLASAAVAATVYRWVDDQGRVHYSDVVPERYRSTARPVDAPAAEPTAEQRQDALERARSERERAAAPSIDRAGPAASAPPSSAASAPPVRRPAQVPNDQTDCETWQRLYEESIECFGPFRTVRGGTKPEAFEVCNVVRAPPPDRCRMRIQ
jgi:hypothetical protein